jgi:hypothetical protein
VAAGSTFTFTPVASDPDGGALAFSVSLNGAAGTKPDWATFSTVTGQLSGIAQAGTYDILISVTDAAAASAHLAFTLTVVSPGPGRTAMLSWAPPTLNTDGSSLTDLAGYRVFRGLSSDALNDVVEIQGEGTTSHTFNGLVSGMHYFAVAAFNASGVQGPLSTVGAKLIP